jgi:hypothetical protein
MVGASPKVISLPRNPDSLAPGELSDQELADQFGEKDRAVQVFKPTADRHKALREEIELRCESKPADQEIFISGYHYRAKASPKQNETTLPEASTLHRMFRAVKADFYAACSVRIAAVKEALGEATFEGIAIKERTGYRRISAVLKDSAA